MMQRFIIAFLLLLVWSGSALAYTVILKDGRRVEVRETFRQVNSVVVFTKSDGKPFSVSVTNIDIPATEKANRQRPGDFQNNMGGALPITDGDAPAPAVAQKSPRKSPARPARVLTNADFGGGRASDPEPVTSPSLPPAQAPASNSSPSEDPETEAYWQGRVRPILMEMQIQVQLYNSLVRQANDLEQKIEQQGRSYTIVRGVGGYVYLPQENNSVEKLELARIRDRMNDVNAQLTSLRVRYAYIQEEARRKGIPPGWVR